MPDPHADPSLRDLELAAAQASDDAAEWLGSLTALGRAVRAARTAGHTITGIGQELARGRAQARHRRAQNRISPSIRLAERSAEVVAAAAANGLDNVRVFGSCARGNTTLLSDVDLIVGTGPRTSLLDLCRFALATEDLLTLPGRVDVLTDDALRPDSDSGARIAAECQPLAAWAAGWPRLDSLPGWLAARAAGASEEELVVVAECGLHRWGEAYTELRYRPAGRPAGATLVAPDEVDRVAVLLARYAPARAAGLEHDAAITRAVTAPHPGVIATTGVVRRPVT